MLKELRIPLIFLFIVVTLGLIYLAAYPQIDLWYSSTFFANGEFIGNKSKMTATIDLLVYFICITIFLLAGLSVIRLVKKEGKINNGAGRLLFFMSVLILGSVCIQTLKFTVERPRPYSIIEFGGPNTFVPALKTHSTDDVFVGNENRSFASGHTASAFALISLAIVGKTKKKRLLLGSAGVIFSFFVGILRISEGNHFLSDIAGGIGLVVFIMLWLDFVFPSLLRRVNHAFFTGK